MASNITMTPKLKDITTSYHSFENDQVLTATQLNEFLTYFEDQDRLTRISLSGVGIVCGFKVSLIQEKVFMPVDTELVTTAEKKLFNSKVTKIVIDQGYGVTTDGDLLYLRENSDTKPLKKIKIIPETYTNYRIYDDHRSKYGHFDRAGVQIPLWELIPGTDITPESTDPSLSVFPDLQDMVVLLYLESYEDDPNLCDGLSCDNQGREQVARLRVLLVSQPDADYILENDIIFNKHELMSTYLKMKDLSVKRVVVNSVNTTSLTNLKASFELSNEAQLITDLKDGLTLMRNKIHPYYDKHPIDSILTALNTKLPAATPSQSLYFQYRYDLLKDIVDSYNEAKELFIEVATECCPSITSFPKHLMLGKLTPNEEDALVGRYRHEFYKSPILVDESKEFEPFIWTLFRMLHQLNAYPVLPETSTGGLYRNDIKITPSNYGSELGQKAIPFYYNLNNSLLRAWNREKTLKGKYKLNLSYNTGLLDNSPVIQTPLRYNLEGSNFLRIEGHQGRDYKEVMAKIDQIKKDNGLSFDLKAISIDLDSSIVIDTTNYECEFEDLAVLLTAWVKEQECTIAKVISLVSAFSVKEPGRNIKDAQYLPKETVLPARDAVAGKTINSKTLEPSVVSAPITAIVSTADQRKALANNEQEFGRTNVVLESLTPTEFTVGHSYLQAVLQNPKGTPAEFIAGANVFANDVVIQHEVIWPVDQYTALVKNSIQIMSYAHVLSNSIPMSIGGITDLIISRYNTNINNLCSVLNKIQVSQANVENLSNTNRAILELLISQLSNICCASKQLQTLLVEIDRRKDAILEKLTLKKFVEEHPGLEHMGGVKQGGTFVLVYLRKGATVNSPSTSTLITSPVLSSSGLLTSAFVPPKQTLSATMATSGTELTAGKTKSTSISTTDSTIQTVSKASTLTPTERLLTDTRALAINPNLLAITQNLFAAPNGTVVADFTLPYMCCSDCSPINFIMPAPIVRLSLPMDTLCLKGTAPITLTFSVEPATGIIKADKVIAGMTITGKQLIIDPRLFPAGSLNTPISFTVNDQITNCKLTVVKPLTAAISAPANPVTSPIVNFLAIGNFPTGTLYNWDFGDGQSSSLRNVTHTYTLPVNSANSLDVTLTVSPASGACPTIITRNIVFAGVEISLEETEYCFNDDTAYNFIITPDGATADISGDGVDPATNTFTPANAFEGEVPIYLNGEEVFSVTVKPDPTVVITGEMTDVGLKLTGTTSDVEAYQWTFVDVDDNEIFPGVDDTLTPVIPMAELAKLDPGTEFYAVLRVKNHCAEKVARQQFFTPQSENCAIDAGLKLKDKYDDLVAFIESNPEFGKLTAAQKDLFINARDYFGLVLENPDAYLSGAKNSEVQDKLGSFELRIYEEIKRTPERDFPDQLKALTGLYRYILEKFLAIIQCQAEADLKNFNPLFDQFDQHLDPESQISFKAINVKIDPEDELLRAVTETLPYRSDGSPSWTSIEDYRRYLEAQ
ncbi:MAG: PKD domain-containing protein [Bacteroidota bacterium]